MERKRKGLERIQLFRTASSTIVQDFADLSEIQLVSALECEPPREYLNIIQLRVPNPHRSFTAVEEFHKH